MFPLSHMLKSFVRVGTLKVVDAKGRVHVFAGAPGPKVTMVLSDPTLYRKLFFNPELHAGEAYMDGRLRFEDSSLRDFLTLFSMNRLELGAYPLQKVLRRISRGFKRFQQANPIGKAQKNVAHHYDLGNDFYRLFLDEGMQYSCAYFLDDDEKSRASASKQASAHCCQAQSEAGPADPRYRQRLGRSRALSWLSGRGGRDRRHTIKGAACSLQ